MNDHFVPWRELNKHFCRHYPNAVMDAVSTGKRAIVQYVGVNFEIRPHVGLLTLSKDTHEDFTVYGPPFVNIFPDSVYNIPNQL